MLVSSRSRLPRVTSVPACVVIFFFGFYVRQLGCTRFRVLGPDHPIVAVMGEDVVLPCHLSPRLNAENMEVRWFRTQFFVYVHLYHSGQDHYSSQMPEYQGRTEFLKEGMSVGNASLRILRTRLSDEGRYRCLIKSGDFYEEAMLELNIAVSGSSPLLSVEDYQDGGIRVGCRASGWYPKPEMLWRDFQGRQLPSFTESSSQDQNGFFEVEKSIVIQRNTKQNVSCSVRNTQLPQEKDLTVSISDPIFPKDSHWMAALFATLAACLASLVIVFLFVLRQRGEFRIEQEGIWATKTPLNLMTLTGLTIKAFKANGEGGMQRKKSSNPNTPQNLRNAMPKSGIVTWKHVSVSLLLPPSKSPGQRRRPSPNILHPASDEVEPNFLVAPTPQTPSSPLGCPKIPPSGQFYLPSASPVRADFGEKHAAELRTKARLGPVCKPWGPPPQITPRGRGPSRDHFSLVSGWRNAIVPMEEAYITLDEDTAHPQLILSAGGRSVRHGHTEQAVPDNPERYDTFAGVLGWEIFFSGRHFWDVDVGTEEGAVWAMGVAKESTKRKGWINPGPQEGILALSHRRGQYWALTSPDPTPLPLAQTPRRIRVYLDFQGQEVAFFNADSQDLLFTFSLAPLSGERICPWFRVGQMAQLHLKAPPSLPRVPSAEDPLLPSCSPLQTPPDSAQLADVTKTGKIHAAVRKQPPSTPKTLRVASCFRGVPRLFRRSHDGASAQEEPPPLPLQSAAGRSSAQDVFVIS
ncbi:butyrophilin subfamily 1 member A1-like [Morphnus guianensis]